jgi:hypothetical protein
VNPGTGAPGCTGKLPLGGNVVPGVDGVMIVPGCGARLGRTSAGSAPGKPLGGMVVRGTGAIVAPGTF